jgi:hypothetical protein
MKIIRRYLFRNADLSESSPQIVENIMVATAPEEIISPTSVTVPPSDRMSRVEITGVAPIAMFRGIMERYQGVLFLRTCCIFVLPTDFKNANKLSFSKIF